MSGRDNKLTLAERLERFPPFQSLGVKLLSISDDWATVRLLLPLNRSTRNPGGSMFGGSIAALADPVPALACNHRFPAYDVWTRELSVDFRRPGLSDLELRFEFPERTSKQIALELAQRNRSTPDFEFGIYDTDGELVAWVNNRVAIRPGS
ncbi:MAG: PaaI family thioesterase [Chromatiales bacterium]|nr:PaaI family thioesterase [Chromatiales bacterium]